MLLGEREAKVAALEGQVASMQSIVQYSKQVRGRGPGWRVKGGKRRRGRERGAGFAAVKVFHQLSRWWEQAVMHHWLGRMGNLERRWTEAWFGTKLYSDTKGWVFALQHPPPHLLVVPQQLACVTGVLQSPPLQELTLRARDAAELTQVKTELVAKEQKVREMKQLVGARVRVGGVTGRGQQAC